MKIWLNGALAEDVTLPATGSGWLMGDGIFESLRTYNGAPFALDRHLHRLVHSAKVMNFEAPDASLIKRGIEDLISAEPYLPYGRLRITLLSDGVIVITHVHYQESDTRIALAQHDFPQSSQRAITGVKTISYAENSVALRRASERGFHDALFINEEGLVVETALANVMWLDDGQWFTPTLASGCLPGVTRALLIENFRIQERDITPSLLTQAEAIAITSSVREIVEIERFESKFFEPSQSLRELKASFHQWILDKLRP